MVDKSILEFLARPAVVAEARPKSSHPMRPLLDLTGEQILVQDFERRAAYPYDNQAVLHTLSHTTRQALT